jgi:N-acetylmuramoyl-L-alanine amidase
MLRRLRLGRILLILAGAAVFGLVAVQVSTWWWKEKRWNWIIIHHTASDYGNLAYFRDLHQRERGWKDIAYHFLINNGTAGTAPGQIEESDLWKRREGGYSTKVSQANQFGIAVVLVGNFENHKVSARQMEALLNLVLRLKREYNIPLNHIVGHRELWQTACPGKHLNMADLRRRIKEMESGASQ